MRMRFLQAAYGAHRRDDRTRSPAATTTVLFTTKGQAFTVNLLGHDSPGAGKAGLRDHSPTRAEIGIALSRSLTSTRLLLSPDLDPSHSITK